MPDYGVRFADGRIRYVDKQLQTIYRQAEKELQEKLADFVRKSAERDKLKRKQLALKMITQEEYDNWLKGQIFQKERWESKVRQVQKVLHDHNDQAAKIVHENKLDVFAENYNYQAFQAEMITGFSFDVVNTQAVTRIIKENPQILPEWKIDEEKDYKWNYAKVRNCVTQEIIQGEGVEKIMKRMSKDLCTMNENKMRTFARTAITGAQNAGRQQQMHDAKDKYGIEQLKQWVATLDNRTRDTHRHLDGQEVPFDKPFDSDLGSIEFPGDPSAEPANVYNCRCTIITIYPKYRHLQKEWRDGETIGDQSYREWKEGKIAGRNNAQRYSPKEKEIIIENERITIDELAKKYGISGKSHDKITVARVADCIINESGYSLPESKWSGKVKVLKEKSKHDGEYDMDSHDILLKENTLLESVIHEQLHARSKGLTYEDYIRYKGIEEACVETLTRDIASRFAIHHAIPHQADVEALRQISELTEMTPPQFAAELLNIPLKERYGLLDKIVGKYAQTPGVSKIEISLYRHQLHTLGG